jgi:hypothetical protein
MFGVVVGGLDGIWNDLIGKMYGSTGAFGIRFVVIGNKMGSKEVWRLQDPQD